MIRFAIIGFLAAVFAVVLAPSKASAMSTFIYSCNIDGFIHFDAITEDGTVLHFKSNIACGPSLSTANGDVIRLVIGEKTEIPAASQAFLTHVERSQPGVARRARAGGGPAAGSGRTTTIYLNRAGVGPNLARLLTSADPTWRRIPAPAAQVR